MSFLHQEDCELREFRAGEPFRVVPAGEVERQARLPGFQLRRSEQWRKGSEEM